MTPPSPSALFDTLDATWPAAQVINVGPWCIREGRNGGQRVSAATAKTGVTDADIPTAEQAMTDLGQTPLFMIRDQDIALDQMLHARGYTTVDPVNIYQARVSDLPADPPRALTFATWPMFGVQQAIWIKGGIGSTRLDVMARATTPKTTILGRTANTPAATAFVAIHQDCAMLHALEVSPDERRKGVGKLTLSAATKWAKEQGAERFTLAVTKANTAANALYTKVGMQPVAQYHYRRLKTPVS